MFNNHVGKLEAMLLALGDGRRGKEIVICVSERVTPSCWIALETSEILDTKLPPTVESTQFSSGHATLTSKVTSGKKLWQCREWVVKHKRSQFMLENVRVCYFLNCMAQAVPGFRSSVGKTAFAKLQPANYCGAFDAFQRNEILLCSAAQSPRLCWHQFSSRLDQFVFFSYSCFVALLFSIYEYSQRHLLELFFE